MMLGFSSTLSLAIFTLTSSSVAISSRAGAIIRQGPHHSAQKSTTTGSEEPSTSLSNDASVTVAGAIAREAFRNDSWEVTFARNVGRCYLIVKERYSPIPEGLHGDRSMAPSTLRDRHLGRIH